MAALRTVLRRIDAIPSFPTKRGLNSLLLPSLPPTLPPGTTVYTLSLWGSKVWIHRGVRTPGCIGYILGRQDLGTSYCITVELSSAEEAQLG